MTPLHLSRVRLSATAHAGTIGALLLDDTRADAAHKLVWSLFSDTGAETRDFLYRQTEQGAFLILSRRPPVDRHALFNIETKPFCPTLDAGQRWRFALRANPVITRARGTGRAGKRDDVVMAALHALPPGTRDEHRQSATRSAGIAWLLARGERHGFVLESRPTEVGELHDLPGRIYQVDVDGYVSAGAPRRRGPPIQLHLLDFEGLLTVSDPDRFAQALEHGIGKARAFGAGLLLIRPA